MTRSGFVVAAVVGLVTGGCFPELPDRTNLGLGLLDEGPEVDRPRIDMAPDTLPDRGPIDAEPDGMDDGRESRPEVCNGQDDDLDGASDEGFELGEACTEGQGECAAQGVTVCRDDGSGVRCDAEPGSPMPELCNGLDDDCSGVIDEGFADLRAPCVEGLGACRAEGVRRCSANGAEVECSVQAANENRTLERCNEVDDDCDGVVDEELYRSCAMESVGICAVGEQQCEAGAWSRCEAEIEPGDRPVDRCDGVDDDCDSSTDEDILSDGTDAPCGGADPLVGLLGECDLGFALDECNPTTPCIEQCDPESNVRTICAPAPEEDCDGADDDCDGTIDDDRVCGQPMVDTCTFGFGWSVEQVAAPAREWGDCDIDAGGFDDTYSCNGARRGQYATISLPAGVDLDAQDDKLGAALRCSPGAVGDYIVRQCRVVIGVAPIGGAEGDRVERWGPCPAARVGADDRVACTSSTADGGFDPMPLPLDLTADTWLGVAFICEDDADSDRAAALQASVAVSLGWADSVIEGEVDWQAVCTPLGDGDPYSACVTTEGDGRFRALRLTADVDGGDRFAIRLSAID